MVKQVTARISCHTQFREHQYFCVRLFCFFNPSANILFIKLYICDPDIRCCRSNLYKSMSHMLLLSLIRSSVRIFIIFILSPFLQNFKNLSALF